jgi:Mn2+/Fe2+ NRAMP family transporter
VPTAASAVRSTNTKGMSRLVSASMVTIAPAATHTKSRRAPSTQAHPDRVRRLVPALAILAAGVDPSRALVVSQVVLSFGIPIALIPLVRFTSDRMLMGSDVKLPDHSICSPVHRGNRRRTQHCTDPSNRRLIVRG